MLDTQVLFLPVEGIAPNPCQPRRAFDPQPLAELAQTKAENGGTLVTLPETAPIVGDTLRLQS